MAGVRWYFDFISPFSYLQGERLREFPGSIELKPVLLAALLGHWKHKGPAEIPVKRRFTYRHAVWLARREGIPFRAPPAHPFNSLSALRLAIVLGPTQETVQSIFRFIWAKGHRTDDPESFAALAARLGVPEAGERIATDEIKLALRANTEEAIARGAFGVPTVEIDGELFWGYDATDMALEYLADPAVFEDAEMRRASGLPIGVERPR